MDIKKELCWIETNVLWDPKKVLLDKWFMWLK